ncbi:hypothetical protein KM043_015935 [Ampulex compressa]|nr:hypothetical protein KM043_015935 [Ampulex compressa]
MLNMDLAIVHRDLREKSAWACSQYGQNFSVKNSKVALKSYKQSLATSNTELILTINYQPRMETNFEELSRDTDLISRMKQFREASCKIENP